MSSEQKPDGGSVGLHPIVGPLPCPFCGVDGVVQEQYCDGAPLLPDGYQPPELYGWTCGCNECGVMFWAEEAQGEGHAVAQWNRRKTPNVELTGGASRRPG